MGMSLGGGEKGGTVHFVVSYKTHHKLLILFTRCTLHIFCCKVVWQFAVVSTAGTRGGPDGGRAALPERGRKQSVRLAGAPPALPAAAAGAACTGTQKHRENRQEPSGAGPEDQTRWRHPETPCQPVTLSPGTEYHENTALNKCKWIYGVQDRVGVWWFVLGAKRF